MEVEFVDQIVALVNIKVQGHGSEIKFNFLIEGH